MLSTAFTSTYCTARQSKFPESPSIPSPHVPLLQISGEEQEVLGLVERVARETAPFTLDWVGRGGRGVGWRMVEIEKPKILAKGEVWRGNGFNKRKQSKFEELKMTRFDQSKKQFDQLKLEFDQVKTGGNLPTCWKLAKKREDFTDKQQGGPSIRNWALRTPHQMLWWKVKISGGSWLHAPSGENLLEVDLRHMSSAQLTFCSWGVLGYVSSYQTRRFTIQVANRWITQKWWSCVPFQQEISWWNAEPSKKRKVSEHYFRGILPLWGSRVIPLHHHILSALIPFTWFSLCHSILFFPFHYSLCHSIAI